MSGIPQRCVVLAGILQRRSDMAEILDGRSGIAEMLHSSLQLARIIVWRCVSLAGILQGRAEMAEMLQNRSRMTEMAFWGNMEEVALGRTEMPWSSVDMAEGLQSSVEMEEMTDRCVRAPLGAKPACSRLQESDVRRTREADPMEEQSLDLRSSEAA